MLQGVDGTVYLNYKREDFSIRTKMHPTGDRLTIVLDHSVFPHPIVLETSSWRILEKLGIAFSLAADLLKKVQQDQTKRG